MKISAMSRFQAIKLERPLKEKTAIISINSWGQPEVAFDPEPNLIAVLPLHFDDVDENSEGGMQKSDAVQIYEFLEKYGDKIEHLIIHCNFGMCRSTAVAAAIIQTATGDSSCVFNWNGLNPNMHIYNTVLNELIDENGKSRISLGKDITFLGREWK